MHILLTDILTCPRCGPAFGLIVLADAVADRRVLEGVLGCANCREKYPVRGGTVLFAGSAAPHDAGAGDPEQAVRLAALTGVTEGPAYILLAGPAAAHAAQLGSLLQDVEVIAVQPSVAGAPAAGSPPARVTPITLGDRLPFASGRLRGIVLSGATADTLLEEGARVMAPLGRLVLEPAPATARGRLEAAGVRVLLHEGDTVIAGRF